ncbi:MAG: site-specific integrase [Alicyclobacillus sp.]|nr:site-specific integrase [Alicyclobacillus sp.]
MRSRGSFAIQDLFERVSSELQRVGYSDRVVTRYRRAWTHLAEYMEEQGVTTYDTKVGLNFLEDAYQITVFKGLSNEDKVRARSIAVLNDYYLHGMVLPKYTTSSVSLLSHHSTVLEGFKEHQKQYQMSPATMKSYEKYIGKFLLYLEKHDVLDLSHITSRTILGYTDMFCGYTPATSHNSLSTLRVFLRYLHEIGIVDEDLSTSVPHVKYRRDAQIPSAFPKEDILRILGAADRSSPTGKRDYAMLLLASKLGLRSGDIRGLTFSNLLWEKNVIELVMSKTGKQITLPLFEDVGMAIIDYVKYGRPKAETDIVFLRHIPPIQQLTAPALSSIVKRYISISGIEVRPGQSQGPHAMRHSLASALLEDNVPLPVISEILGHTDTRTTENYLKIGIKQLRGCSQEVPEFDWNVEKEVF